MLNFIKLTIITIALGMGLIGFFYIQNNHIVVTKFDLSNPRSQNEIRIVHLSDLQCKRFGNHQEQLIQKIRALKPDLIVFTGDLVDAFHYNQENWTMLISELPSISPIYFVSGNHEWWCGNFQEVEAILVQNGINVLRNKTDVVLIKNRRLSITGIDDPEGFNHHTQGYLDELKKLNHDLPYHWFSILLVHRPEYFKVYDNTRFNLIFAGHAHGGQFRLPFLGGVFAPNQGIFPQYSAGIYVGSHARMLVSRGLGNSVFPLRLFNYPEILVVDI